MAVLPVADLPGAAWFNSSYSGGESNCVDMADLRRTQASIAVRDSKTPRGLALLFTPEAFSQFARDAANSRHDTA
ncbi:DUF397 domain-containing protein [Streptomyces sp. NRRL S-813]|uniref:DUF397 domain-containing protein n=1 Tax=Streptomyces sp. NRRL S-813 TaxID=1463919 RepID=UPI00099CC7C7|nr:DUF397 domain-containing protein [Streptomyces sp. NRRL S-813]